MIKGVLTFVAGAVAGAAVSFFVTKVYLDRKHQEDLDKHMKIAHEVKEEYDSENKNIDETDTSLDQWQSSESEGSDQPSAAFDQEELKKIVREHSYKGGDYHDYSTGQVERLDLADDKRPTVQHSPIEECEYWDYKNPPEGYKTEHCSYTASDGHVDFGDSGIFREDFHMYFGDALDGETDTNDEIYVRNDNHKTIYEIYIEEGDSGLVA